LKEKVAAAVYKTENTAVGIRCADYAAPIYPQKLALTLPTSSGRWDSDHRVCYVFITQHRHSCTRLYGVTTQNTRDTCLIYPETAAEHTMYGGHISYFSNAEKSTICLFDDRGRQQVVWSVCTTRHQPVYPSLQALCTIPFRSKS
jgi:hypothetical protein